MSLATLRPLTKVVYDGSRNNGALMERVANGAWIMLVELRHHREKVHLKRGADFEIV